MCLLLDRATSSSARIDVEALTACYMAHAARIGVMGSGYVSLPLVKTMAECSFTVTWLDVDADKVAAHKAGRSYIHHIASEMIVALVVGGHFWATTDSFAIRDFDAALICVPTPLKKHWEPNRTYVVETDKEIAPHLCRGRFVVLALSAYLRTNSEVLALIFETGGLCSGRDFSLVYLLEREDQGNPDFGASAIPKVISGNGAEALYLVHALYDQFVSRTAPVPSTATAQAFRLTGNIFRAVNITLVSELKIIFGAMGVDVWAVINITKIMLSDFILFCLELELGGCCIPIDLVHLTRKAREYEISTRFTELAGELNTVMPCYVVDRLAQALDRCAGRGLNGAALLIVGVVYRKNADEVHENSSLALMEIFENKGARVDHYVPFVRVILVTCGHVEWRTIVWSAEAIRHHEAALMTTDHNGMDYTFVVVHANPIADTRNARGEQGSPGRR